MEIRAVNLQLILGVLFCLEIPFVAAALAEEKRPDISIELNTTQEVDGKCRLVLVAANKSEVSIDNLTLEAVLFDAQGSVSQFTLLDFQDLPQSKLRVRQFDIADTSCGSLSKVLLNGVSKCEGQGLDPTTCGRFLKISSKAKVEFDG